jgi:signal transduction histidine kinase
VVGRAVAAPWQWIATVATVLSVLYIVDASVSLWRSGTRDARRKALVVGGGIALFFAVAILNTQLIIWGFLERTPTLTAPAFLIALAAMAFEMSRDTLRASRLAQDLRQSERALDLAASAAGLGLWSWNAEKNQLWATERGRAMLGVDSTGPVEIPRLASIIFSEDLQSIRELLKLPGLTGKELEIQFRVCPGGAAVRWIQARGRWEPDGIIRGVLRDVTDQLRTQQELEELQRNLAHTDRVTTLGQLASTLTHELRQPQAAILANVEAAKMLLRDPNPDLQDLREILEDIHRDHTRAGEVIDRLRAMMKRRPMEFQPVAVDSLVLDVISLLRSEAATRGIGLTTEIDHGPLVVPGDRVHLTQVLINLILNAMDAVSGAPRARQRVIVQAHAADNEWIEVAVADCGTGVSPEVMKKIFEPFFTTKVSGMGMGLAISRTIVEAHGGRLQAENNTEGGATFRLTLRAVQAMGA